MKRRSVGYRDILSQLLDLPVLSADERRAIHAALSTGVPEAEAARARAVLERLAADGRVIRSHREDPRGGRRLVFSTLDGFSSFSFPDAQTVAPPAEPVTLARPLDTRPTLDPEAVRALLSLQGRLLSRGSRLLAGPAEALMHGVIVARRLLDAEHAAVHLLRPAAARDTDLHRQLPPVPLALTDEVERVARENLARTLPDLTQRTDAAQCMYRSVALVPLGSESHPVEAVLSVWSTHPAHFGPERLALLDLLGEVVSDLLLKSDALGQLVFIDPLTQVYNRSYFNMQIRKEIARAKREGASMVLCIFDLDDFKRLNDAPYGYEGANQVLRQVADVLRRQVRPFDCVARWGGEEYAVLLAAPMNRRDAAAICERLRRVVDGTPFTLTGLDGQSHRLHITMCGGIAVYPQDGLTAEDLWRHANEALIDAKRGAKNVVVFWASDRPASPDGGPAASPPPPATREAAAPGAAPPSPPADDAV